VEDPEPPWIVIGPPVIIEPPTPPEGPAPGGGSRRGSGSSTSSGFFSDPLFYSAQFCAGFGDTLTFGLTGCVRELWEIDDVMGAALLKQSVSSRRVATECTT
jgi:hypothetical protein